MHGPWGRHIEATHTRSVSLLLDPHDATQSLYLSVLQARIRAIFVQVSSRRLRIGVLLAYAGSLFVQFLGLRAEILVVLLTQMITLPWGYHRTAPLPTFLH